MNCPICYIPMNYYGADLVCPPHCILVIIDNIITHYNIYGKQECVFGAVGLCTKLCVIDCYDEIISVPYIEINNQNDLDGMLPRLLKLKAFI